MKHSLDNIRRIALTCSIATAVAITPVAIAAASNSQGPGLGTNGNGTGNDYTHHNYGSEAEFITRFEEPAKRFLDAKFWIDNRDVEADEFEALLTNNSVVSTS